MAHGRVVPEEVAPGEDQIAGDTRIVGSGVRSLSYYIRSGSLTLQEAREFSSVTVTSASVTANLYTSRGPGKTARGERPEVDVPKYRSTVLGSRSPTHHRSVRPSTVKATNLKSSIPAAD